MKKIISAILLCVLLLICFSGCAGTQGGPVELPRDDALVRKLVEYLGYYSSEFDLTTYSISEKIDQIRDGTQALRVRFDGAEAYFVCAYYGGPETDNYDSAADYTWVKYESANEIGEKYKDMELVIAFQVDKAAFVTDIVNGDAAAPGMELFREYAPEFKDGLNTNAAVEYCDSFIYLNSSDDKIVYHSRSFYDDCLNTIPFSLIDDQYYIVSALYAIMPNGDRLEYDDFTGQFGEYSDAFASIMDADGYTSTYPNGAARHSGLIEAEAFSNCIKQVVGG